MKSPTIGSTKSDEIMARDLYHQDVKDALVKDGWAVTADPLTYKVGTLQIQIDLGAERLIAAERDDTKIAIEIKTFIGASFNTALYEAIGKYIVYRNVIALQEEERVLYLAVPELTYQRFLVETTIIRMLKIECINLVIYNPSTQLISTWVKN
ncbi:MAG: element excision factor XisH family protein [Saprospiraceae bacterium]|nr:element excision factor XisH family protein [Saprospiraceae bacterium]